MEDERKDVLREESKLKISAAAGFSGHESGESNLYQLGLGVNVSKEMYPGEFKFRTNTSLVIQDSKLQENVTLLNLSYEHYLTPWLETYGFLEHFAKLTPNGSTRTTPHTRPHWTPGAGPWLTSSRGAYI